MALLLAMGAGSAAPVSLRSLPPSGGHIRSTASTAAAYPHTYVAKHTGQASKADATQRMRRSRSASFAANAHRSGVVEDEGEADLPSERTTWLVTPTGTSAIPRTRAIVVPTLAEAVPVILPLASCVTESTVQVASTPAMWIST